MVGLFLGLDPSVCMLGIILHAPPFGWKQVDSGWSPACLLSGGRGRMT